MIDLKNFPKIGVRVPNALKRRVKQLALDMGDREISFQGDDLTMEAIFAVAALELIAKGVDEKARVFERRIPELLAMFEAESPDRADCEPDVYPGEEGKASPRRKKGGAA